jgi:hypothetical protein
MTANPGLSCWCGGHPPLTRRIPGGRPRCRSVPNRLRGKPREVSENLSGCCVLGGDGSRDGTFGAADVGSIRFREVRAFARSAWGMRPGCRHGKGPPMQCPLVKGGRVPPLVGAFSEPTAHAARRRHQGQATACQKRRQMEVFIVSREADAQQGRAAPAAPAEMFARPAIRLSPYLFKT